jgi:hypothetical protein
MNQSPIRFAVDRMLGRLARMLRLLGYDTEYSPDISTAELRAIAQGTDRIILTRGQAEKRYPGLHNVYSVRSDHAPEQLREVVERFRLDPRRGLWTRCTLCNATLAPATKPEIAQQVESKILELYDEFFRCSGCGHIYWHGSQVARILKHLDVLLPPPAS